MADEISILAVPGLASQAPAFIWRLGELATRHGWDPSGIAAVISHESRFQPAARSSLSTATGLIQFIESTARKLGTTTAELARMSALEQLPFVEAYFQKFMPRIPDRPEDYILVTYGRPDVVGAPDSTVLDRRDSEDRGERARYEANSVLDAHGSGAITVGDLRTSISHVLNAARGKYVRAVRPSDGGAGAAGLLAVAILFGPQIARGIREVFR